MYSVFDVDHPGLLFFFNKSVFTRAWTLSNPYLLVQSLASRYEYMELNDICPMYITVKTVSISQKSKPLNKRINFPILTVDEKMISFLLGKQK